MAALIVDYDPAKNPHTLDGARTALNALLAENKPSSLVDVGCGPGTWLRAALEIGITDCVGVDGLALASDQLYVDKKCVITKDLAQRFDLRRRFDLALCLEVAEHIPSASAPTLIESLALHSDRILFSAAIPGQPGQHHINCQWPVYWQRLFNRHGFVCDDSARWQIWDEQTIEPWYRQNMFWAQYDPAMAGREQRLKSTIHPDVAELMNQPFHAEDEIKRIEEGSMSWTWYATLPARAAFAKLWRKRKKRRLS